MSDLTYWTQRLQEAEAELEAATKRTDVNEAARRLMRVKAELRALERQPATRRASGVGAPAASS